VVGDRKEKNETKAPLKIGKIPGVQINPADKQSGQNE